jgi:hypothetical protein
MHIVVVGPAKSGTTALYFAVLKSLQGRVFTLFEPQTAPQMEAVFGVADHDHTLTKVLLGEAVNSHIDFTAADKIVFLSRDPRDNVISRLLYRAVLFKRSGDLDAFMEYDALIRAKVDGKPIAVKNIFQESLRLTGAAHEWSGLGLKWACDHALRFVQDVDNCFVLKFEDLVDGHLTALSAYLGIEVKRKTRVAEHYKRVERSRSYGEWVHWFTPSDVEFYRPLFAEYMEFFGYDDDYSLESKRAISRRNSIDYIQQFKPV